MGRTWGTGLVVTAGLLGAVGCNSTARPMLFHRNNPEPAPCPPAGMPMSDGPMLGDMPVMTPGMTMGPNGMPPGTVTIPGPGVVPPPPAQAVPPAASPPVGPQPRVAPTNPTQLPGKPTT